MGVRRCAPGGMKGPGEGPEHPAEGLRLQGRIVRRSAGGDRPMPKEALRKTCTNPQELCLTGRPTPDDCTHEADQPGPAAVQQIHTLA